MGIAPCVRIAIVPRVVSDDDHRGINELWRQKGFAADFPGLETGGKGAHGCDNPVISLPFLHGQWSLSVGHVCMSWSSRR